MAVPAGETNSEELEQRLREAEEVAVPTRYLNRQTLGAALVFAPGSLKSSRNDITTFDDPAIYRHYLQAWNENL
jgi:predicted membrane-bound spermidine synthase